MRLTVLLLISSALSKVCPKLFLHLVSISVCKAHFFHFSSLWLGRDWILMVIYGAEYFMVLDNRPVFRQINTSNSLSLKKRNSHSTHLGWFNSIAFVILSTMCNAEWWDQWSTLAMTTEIAYLLVKVYPWVLHLESSSFHQYYWASTRLWEALNPTQACTVAFSFSFYYHCLEPHSQDVSIK